MHNESTLLKDIEKSGMNPKGTLLIHSSMKAVGEVDGGADTVLNAFIHFMKEGLLLFPTHSWDEKSLKDGIYDPKTEPSNVGILPNLFMKKEGAVRSLHPTHSVTAIGKRAVEYAHKDDEASTPCPWNGCFGSLYEEDAQILFLGTTLKKNTFLHGVEEKLNIPDRISSEIRKLKIKISENEMKEIDYYGHKSSLGDVSHNYDKIQDALLKKGFAKIIKIGDAESILVQVRPMADLAIELLTADPEYFSCS